MEEQRRSRRAPHQHSGHRPGRVAAVRVGRQRTRLGRRGDFNGDGKENIAWYEAGNNGTVKVLFSNGSGMGSIVNWVSGWGKPDWATCA